MVEPMTGPLLDVVRGSGPFASLYLDTRADFEEAPRQIDLRWRALRDQLQQEGAPESVLAQLDQAVDGAHREGDGLVVVAGFDRVLLRRHLSTPIDDAARWGPGAHLAPLLEWQQENPPYAVVLVDRTGAEIEVSSSWRPEYATQVEGDEWPVRRISPGGWSQRRFQERAANLWEQNARDVAAVVEKIASDDALELVIVSGDVRAVSLLRENLSESFSPTLYVLEGIQAHSVEEIAEEINKAVATHTAQITESILDAFREERGQDDRAVEGAGQTARALSEERVETLILAGPPDKSVYASEQNPAQVGTDRQALVDLGLGEVLELPLVDAFVRSALAGGSNVRVVPSLSSDHAPADGVGAILRYTYR